MRAVWRSETSTCVSLTVHGPPFAPPPDAQRVKQVHGATVLDAPLRGRLEADGIALLAPGNAWVGVADCLAVALLGPRGAALVHAGWRGLAAGILEAGSEAVGGAKEAAVAPHARSCCYSFDPALAREAFGAAAERALTEGEAGATLSLARLAREKLRAPVADLGGCTMCSGGWASRRSGDKSHNWAVLEWT